MLKAVTNSVSGARLEDPAVFAGVNCRQIAGPRLQPDSLSKHGSISQIMALCQGTVSQTQYVVFAHWMLC